MPPLDPSSAGRFFLRDFFDFAAGAARFGSDFFFWDEFFFRCHFSISPSSGATSTPPDSASASPVLRRFDSAATARRVRAFAAFFEAVDRRLRLEFFDRRGRFLRAVFSATIFGIGGFLDLASRPSPALRRLP